MALPALGAFVLQILLLTCDVHAQGAVFPDDRCMVIVYVAVLCTRFYV